MNSFGIKYQLRITTVIPVLIVALLFALFYNGQFGRDLKQNTYHLGEAYIRQLLPPAQFAMMHNDMRTLQGLVYATTVNPEIKSIAFYNENGQLIAYRGGKHSLNKPFNPPAYTGDYIEHKQIDSLNINFVAPITIPRFNLYSQNPRPDTPEAMIYQIDDIIGWLSIDVDTQSMLIKRYQMLIMTIFITLFGVLIGLTIHYLLSRRIYIPISRLRRSMKQILSNEFETKIRVTSNGEMGIIEKGCSHLQKQYLQMVKELNQHIEDATLDLQQSLELLEEKNIELSMDKKKTEEKSRQKSEFIANMSHEIRTPMNGVLGFTNVLLESKLDPLQMDYVKTIKSSAQDLLAIINDVLDYSKMDAGKLHLDSIPLDIRSCIDEVLALNSPSAYKKGLDLIPITDLSVPKTIVGDPLRIKQVLTNLVNNAIKFTDQGNISIRTRIENETERDYILTIAVKDTGIGIAPEDQAKLFNAFHQADTSITRRYGGSGLGLVICHKLVEQMQGKITLTSEINQGSTFTVQIKLEKVSNHELEKNQAPRFNHLKVLCFDEHALHLEALSHGLEYWGIDCTQASTFDKLKEHLEKGEHYDLAFINLDPGQEEPVSNLLHSYPHIPFVLVSKKTIHDYQALGAQAFLFKPVSIQKLHDIIDSLINQTFTPKTHHELDGLREQLRVLHPDLLIAEDNPVNRLLLQSLLKEHCSLDVVHDGDEAVSICNQRQFHAILLDLQMPKLNGLEAAKLIRQQSLLNKHTPIILISANTNDIRNSTLKKSGIALCLQKPIDEKQLLLQLIKLIDKAQHAPIDWALCVQKVSGNQKLAEEYLVQFIEELKQNREEFLDLMRQEDVPALAALAHKLHGACCFCGVPHLQNKVVDFEKMANAAAQADALKPLFAELIQKIDDVINEFNNQYV